MNPSWESARNLLCVRLDGAGDVLLATPAIRALRQSGPRGRRITLLASKAGSLAAAHVPEVDVTIAYDAPWVGSPMPPAAAAELAMRYALAMKGFDAAVILTTPSQDPLPAAMLCRVAGIPLRLAQGPKGAATLLTRAVEESEADRCGRHEVRRQLDLVAAIGARTDDEKLSFRVRPQATSRARVKLEEAGIDLQKNYLVVHAGATASRNGCTEHLAAAARELGKALDLQVAVTGEASERALAEAVRRGAGDTARSLAGCLSLEEFAATLEMAAFLLAHDPAAFPLASALRTPVVASYDPTHPGEVPWMISHRLLPGLATAQDIVAAACDLWLDIHWRVAA